MGHHDLRIVESFGDNSTSVLSRGNYYNTQWYCFGGGRNLKVGQEFSLIRKQTVQLSVQFQSQGPKGPLKIIESDDASFSLHTGTSSQFGQAKKANPKSEKIKT